MSAFIKKISETKMKTALEYLMGVLVLTAAVCLFAGSSLPVGTARATVGASNPLVILDAGHGGEDPGKIGVDGTMEKDLNLLLAKRVCHLLEQQDIIVYMTRESDELPGGGEAGSRKVQDMKARCLMMNEKEPDCIVSIHQNSYHQESIHGAQVFFYEASAEGKKLAETLQKELIRVADPENRRQAKANDSYYLLKKTKPPICIVECGFLSNWEESARLKDPEYQERLAWAIHMGILRYLNP